MVRYLKFVFVGTIFALIPGEVWLLVFQGKDFSSLRTTAISYLMGISVFYFIERRLPKTFYHSALYYFMAGFIGLAIEWLLLGNAPWNGMSIFAQFEMFAFWTTVLVMPRIFTDKSFPEYLWVLKRKIKKYYVFISTVILLALALVSRNTGLVFVVGVASFAEYIFLNIFLIKYILFFRGGATTS